MRLKVLPLLQKKAEQGTTAYNNAALKDVILNDTPVLKATADSTNPQTTDFNFQDVINPRFGTADQINVEGIESSSSITSVGSTVTAASPITRQITNSDVDAVNVTITFTITESNRKEIYLVQVFS